MTLRAAALLLVLVLGFLATPASVAGQPAKTARIGILWLASRPAGPSPINAFRQGLRDLGYVEDRNIVIEYRWAEENFDRVPVLAAELRGLKVDVIVTTTTTAARMVRQGNPDIPIVAVMGDPVAGGVAKSIARPGGNVTGVATLSPELNSKRLEILKEAVPKLAVVAVLTNRGFSPITSGLREIEAAAARLGIQVRVVEVGGPQEFEAALGAAIKSRAQGVVVVASPIFGTHMRTLVDVVAKTRLPAIYEQRDFVAAGGLMSYGYNVDDLFRRLATYVDKILKGAKPADLPVEQPTRFELVVNLKTVKALGLKLPQSILVRADRVVQ